MRTWWRRFMWGDTCKICKSPMGKHHAIDGTVVVPGKHVDRTLKLRTWECPS